MWRPDFANVAAFPLVGFILRILNELVLCFPIAPTIPSEKSIGQVLLRPRRIVFHLGIPGLLLQFLDLPGGVVLSMKVDGQSDTTERDNND